MTQIFLHVTLISLLFFCEQRPVLVAAEMPSKQAAPIGERLTYDISWLNILAGTAVMEVMVRWHGRRRFTAETSDDCAVATGNHVNSFPWITAWSPSLIFANNSPST